MADLTARELALRNSLPQPSAQTDFQANAVWIVEWLRPSDRKTGHELHSALERLRPGWSHYRPCDTKASVLASIAEATQRAQRSSLRPILQLEGHGLFDTNGLVLPTTDEVLPWDELTQPLQRLNQATGMNLCVQVAACSGIAGLKAMTQGPRAPALVVVGPDAVITDEKVLAASRAFYEGLSNGTPSYLQALVDRMTQVSGIGFHAEPFTELCYNGLLDQVQQSVRPEAWRVRVERMRAALTTRLSPEKVEAQLRAFLQIMADKYQEAWDIMFAMELFPENRSRFGCDTRGAVRAVLADAGLVPAP